MNCPKCNSTRVYRSRTRNITEKALRTLLPIHYYRCHECNWRSQRIEKQKLNIALIILLGALTGFLVYEIAGPALRTLVNLLFM